MAFETMNELHLTLQVALDTHLSLNLMFDNHRGKKNNNNKKRTNERTNEQTNKQLNNSIYYVSVCIEKDQKWYHNIKAFWVVLE